MLGNCTLILFSFFLADALEKHEFSNPFKVFTMHNISHQLAKPLTLTILTLCTIPQTPCTDSILPHPLACRGSPSDSTNSRKVYDKDSDRDVSQASW